MLQGNANPGLADLSVSITGRLATMTHEAAAALIAEFGGRYVHSVSRQTNILVCGQEGWPLGNDGQPTQRLRLARSLRSDGYDIEILQEDAFLTRLGLLDQHESIHRRYTMVQLSRILGVSRSRMKTWARVGLIEPVETIHRLAYFDYQQVSTAKMLEQLVREGLSPIAIRRGLERLRNWLPGTEGALAQVSSLECDGAVLVRLHSGELAEPTGQLRFDFEAAQSQNSPAVAGKRERTAEESFQAAIEFEDQGDYQAAADCYREAIARDESDPVLYFNLGNVLYQLGDLPEAIDHFERATRLDSQYVEAWNNLGSLLYEAGRHREAVSVLRRALQLVPNYADAHFNLADCLASIGDQEGARKHWEVYLKLDPRGAMADQASFK